MLNLISKMLKKAVSPWHGVLQNMAYVRKWNSSSGTGNWTSWINKSPSGQSPLFIYFWTSHFKKLSYIFFGYKNLLVFNDFVTIMTKCESLCPYVMYFYFIFITVKIACITLLLKIYIYSFNVYLYAKKTCTPFL